MAIVWVTKLSCVRTKPTTVHINHQKSGWRQGSCFIFNLVLSYNDTRTLLQENITSPRNLRLHVFFLEFVLLKFSWLRYQEPRRVYYLRSEGRMRPLDWSSYERTVPCWVQSTAVLVHVPRKRDEQPFFQFNWTLEVKVVRNLYMIVNIRPDWVVCIILT